MGYRKFVRAAFGVPLTISIENSRFPMAKYSEVNDDPF